MYLFYTAYTAKSEERGLGRKNQRFWPGRAPLAEHAHTLFFGRKGYGIGRCQGLSNYFPEWLLGFGVVGQGLDTPLDLDCGLDQYLSVDPIRPESTHSRINTGMVQALFPYFTELEKRFDYGP